MPLFKAKHLHSCDRTFTRTLALFRRMFISRVADFATLAKPSTAIATAGDHVVTLDTRTALGTTWALSGAIGVLLRCGACSLRPATVGASLVTRMAALLLIAHLSGLVQDIILRAAIHGEVARDKIVTTAAHAAEFPRSSRLNALLTVVQHLLASHHCIIIGLVCAFVSLRAVLASVETRIPAKFVTHLARLETCIE